MAEQKPADLKEKVMSRTPEQNAKAQTIIVWIAAVGSVLVTICMVIGLMYSQPKAVSTKPTVHVSELRPVVQEYIERMCQLREKHFATKCTPEEKKKWFEETLSKIISEGFYNYVDP
ncbi:hypothetical protein HYT05_01290 [Candidatus Kaiserbacteria bacterium]|nr:hypothetical protein [Candidatus Kaiserbacteria bacterium]